MLRLITKGAGHAAASRRNHLNFVICGQLEGYLTSHARRDEGHTAVHVSVIRRGRIERMDYARNAHEKHSQGQQTEGENPPAKLAGRTGSRLRNCFGSRRPAGGRECRFLGGHGYLSSVLVWPEPLWLTNKTEHR